MTISALCIFSGNMPKSDPDAAAEALRAAGYQVFRLPAELNKSEVEGDDFIEIRREGDADDAAIDAMWADAQRIVDPFDGGVDCVGPASEEPFNDLTCPPLDRGDYCGHCMGPGTPDRPLLSIDVGGGGGVLLHNDCWKPWLDALIAAGPRLFEELPF
jgi:hypothetical protein